MFSFSPPSLSGPVCVQAVDARFKKEKYEIPLKNVLNPILTGLVKYIGQLI